MDRAQKAAELSKLRQEAEASARGGEGFVFGEGAPDANLAIVGEAPGPEEERRGRPFVGRAGELLNRLLAEAGIPREDTWITNVVKRYPTKVVQNRRVTRAPTTDEIKSDLPWLERELAILRPEAVLCLGSVPAGVLIRRGFRLTIERGRWFEGPAGLRAMATFHPAYILRQRRDDRDRLFALALEDFASIRRALAERERQA